MRTLRTHNHQHAHCHYHSTFNEVQALSVAAPVGVEPRVPQRNARPRKEEHARRGVHAHAVHEGARGAVHVGEEEAAEGPHDLARVVEK